MYLLHGEIDIWTLLILSLPFVVVAVAIVYLFYLAFRRPKQQPGDKSKPTEKIKRSKIVTDHVALIEAIILLAIVLTSYNWIC